MLEVFFVIVAGIANNLFWCWLGFYLGKAAERKANDQQIAALEACAEIDKQEEPPLAESRNADWEDVYFPGDWPTERKAA